MTKTGYQEIDGQLYSITMIVRPGRCGNATITGRETRVDCIVLAESPGVALRTAAAYYNHANWPDSSFEFVDSIQIELLHSHMIELKECDG